AIELQPNGFAPHRTRAALCITIGEYEKALADLREIDRIDPEQSAGLRRQYASFLDQRSRSMWQSNPAAALQALHAAVEIDPKNATAQNNLAWMLLTGPKELRDARQALPHALSAVELKEDQLSLNTLGVAHYRNGQCTEAVAVLEKSLAAGKGE